MNMGADEVCVCVCEWIEQTHPSFSGIKYVECVMSL